MTIKQTVKLVCFYYQIFELKLMKYTQCTLTCYLLPFYNNFDHWLNIGYTFLRT